MSANKTIRRLLKGASKAAKARQLTRGSAALFEEARRDAREAWVRETVAKMKAAQHAVDEAWGRLLEDMDEAEIEDIPCDDLPELPEEAVLRQLMAELEAVRDHDRWPQALYWGGV